MNLRALQWMVLVLVSAGVLNNAVADQPLRFNPFDKPELVAIKPVESSLVDDVRRQPRLKATLVSSGQPMVMLEDRLMTLDEEYEGYVLRSVGEQSAVFEFAGETIEIKVPDPQADKGFRR